MRKLLILSRALGKGFVRDRASLFFSVVFPLMFLVLFGGVFNVGTLKTSLIEIGKVPLFSAQIKQEYKDAVRFKQYDSRSKAIAQVRKGKYVAASRTDRVATNWLCTTRQTTLCRPVARRALSAPLSASRISRRLDRRRGNIGVSLNRAGCRRSREDRGSHRGSRRLGDLADGFRVWKLHPA